MTDVLDRARWLEPHDLFEGVGAHELNPRYTHVDGGGFDDEMHDGLKLAPRTFIRAQSLIASTIRLDGPDISHYQIDQGPVEWLTIAASCWFMMVKLTQSVRYLDPTAQRSLLSMKAVGVQVPGIYHWLSSTTDPEEQAAWTLKNLADAEKLFAALDDEESGVTVEKSLGWLEAVEAKRKRPSPVYTGAYVAGGTIWTDPRIREGKYGPRPMMLAAYTTEARARALPGVAAHPWHSWQFSSSGPVPGVVGRCDMNRVDDRPAFERAAGITVAPPIPQESDMPAMVKNTEPHDIGDGHGPYDPNVIHWEVVDGAKVHITSVAVVKAYGGTERAVGLSNADLATIPTRTEALGEVIESGPLTFTGHLASVPGDFTITAV